MPEADAELDGLIDELYPVWARYRPDLAQGPGRHRLPPVDDDDLAALCSWMESAVFGLDEIDCDALDPDRRVDFELLQGAVRAEHGELLDPSWRCRDLGRLLPTRGLLRLILDPPDPARPALVELLAAVPERLRHIHGILAEQPERLSPTLVVAAAGEAETGQGYLRALLGAPWVHERCYGLSELEGLGELARLALGDFRDFLLRDLAPRASGPLGVGAERLVDRLRYRHFMEGDLSGLAQALRWALDQTVDALDALPDAGGATARDAEDVAAPGLSPPRIDRLSLYRRVCEASRHRLEASGLVGLPAVPLQLALLPSGLGRGAGQAGYLAGAASGTLLVPPTPTAGERETLAQVRADCLAQGWGGAHLLAWSAPDLALHPARRAANGASLSLAWIDYLGVRLAERSGDAQSLRRVLSLRGQRLLLGLLDLELHGQRLGAEDALDRARSLGLDPVAAESQVVRIALVPGDAAAGALGIVLLREARARQSAIDERPFNDRLLSQGPIPLPLALRRGFGDQLYHEVWGALTGDRRT